MSDIHITNGLHNFIYKFSESSTKSNKTFEKFTTIGGNPHQTVKFENGAFTFAIL